MEKFPRSRRIQVLGDPILGVPAERRLDGTTCPKCLSVASPRYRCGARGSDATGPEHLHWKCPCGYQWNTACADCEGKS